MTALDSHLDLLLEVEPIARPRVTHRLRRRCEIRKEAALGFVLALRTHGPMSLADVARALGIAPGSGTLRNARNDLRDAGTIRAEVAKVSNARGDLILTELYLLRDQQLPVEEDPPAAEVIDWSVQPPDPDPPAPRATPCRCGTTPFSADSCWKCGRPIAVMAA